MRELNCYYAAGGVILHVLTMMFLHCRQLRVPCHPLRAAGNPEEGELRPQLLDRFGMHAQIGTVKDPRLRVQIVSQRGTFDDDPSSFR